MGSAPFCGRSRNPHIAAFGTAYGDICPRVLDVDMTVIWPDAIPIPAHAHAYFSSKSGRLWAIATRRLLICTAMPAIVQHAYEGTEMALGLGTSPIHSPGFEKNPLFHLHCI